MNYDGIIDLSQIRFSSFLGAADNVAGIWVLGHFAVLYSLIFPVYKYFSLFFHSHIFEVTCYLPITAEVSYSGHTIYIDL